MRRRRALNDAAALFRRHLAPLLAQLLAPLWRHLPEPVELLAHVLLPLRWKRLELLPPLPQQLALLGSHGAPLGEALLRTGALLGSHGQPSLTAPCQGLLALGGQRSPAIVVAVQQLLLLRG
jgi:hypothetical protein